MGTTCDNPEKVAYPSERAAKRAMRNHANRGRDGGGGRLHVYRCAGHWHIGHANLRWQDTPGKRLR